MANQIQPCLMWKILRMTKRTYRYNSIWRNLETSRVDGLKNHFEETWKLMDSLVQPCSSQLLPVCLRLPSKFSQGHTVTLHLPNGGVKCQSRIQHTEETCLKPTPCSASILEIPDRHRNYRKQIRLDMLSTNTNQRTHEGCVETIGSVLSNLQGKHMLLESVSLRILSRF